MPLILEPLSYIGPAVSAATRGYDRVVSDY